MFHLTYTLLLLSLNYELMYVISVSSRCGSSCRRQDGTDVYSYTDALQKQVSYGNGGCIWRHLADDPEIVS